MLPAYVVNSFRHYMEATAPRDLPKPERGPRGAYDALPFASKKAPRDLSDVDTEGYHSATDADETDLDTLLAFLETKLTPADFAKARAILTQKEDTAADEPTDGGGHAAEMRRRREPYRDAGEPSLLPDGRRTKVAQALPLGKAAPWGSKENARQPYASDARAVARTFLDKDREVAAYSYKRMFPDTARLSGSSGAPSRTMASDARPSSGSYDSMFPEAKRIKQAW